MNILLINIHVNQNNNKNKRRSTSVLISNEVKQKLRNRTNWTE